MRKDLTEIRKAQARQHPFATFVDAARNELDLLFLSDLKLTAKTKKGDVAVDCQR
jgi:hypothetical protein